MLYRLITLDEGTFAAVQTAQEISWLVHVLQYARGTREWFTMVVAVKIEHALLVNEGKNIAMMRRC
jgi:hypothetical protein